MHCKTIYLYLKDGTIINSYIDIPEKEITLIVDT